VVPKVGIEIQTSEVKGQKGSQPGGPNQNARITKCGSHER